MASILREDFPLFCSAPSTFYLQILVNITLWKNISGVMQFNVFCCRFDTVNNLIWHKSVEHELETNVSAVLLLVFS